MLDCVRPQQASTRGHSPSPGGVVGQRRLLDWYSLLPCNITLSDHHTGNPEDPALHLRILHHLSGPESLHNLCAIVSPVTYYLDNIFANIHTGCIIIRLWTVHKGINRVFPPGSRANSRQISFADVMLIIVESAVLYTATVVFSVAFEVGKSNAYYGVADVVSRHAIYPVMLLLTSETARQSLEVAGISFDLIIIRIWQGTSAEQTQAFTQSASRSTKFDGTQGVRVTTVRELHESVDTNALELQVVLPPDDMSKWRVKGVEGAV